MVITSRNRVDFRRVPLKVFNQCPPFVRTCGESTLFEKGIARRVARASFGTGSLSDSAVSRDIFWRPLTNTNSKKSLLASRQVQKRKGAKDWLQSRCSRRSNPENTFHFSFGAFESFTAMFASDGVDRVKDRQRPPLLQSEEGPVFQEALPSAQPERHITIPPGSGVRRAAGCFSNHFRHPELEQRWAQSVQFATKIRFTLA